jgi:hypothetical protein
MTQPEGRNVQEEGPHFSPLGSTGGLTRQRGAKVTRAPEPVNSTTATVRPVATSVMPVHGAQHCRLNGLVPSTL